MLHQKSQRQHNEDINALFLPSPTPLAGPPVSLAKPWIADVTLTGGFAQPDRSGAGISNPRAFATYSRQELAGTEEIQGNFAKSQSTVFLQSPSFSDPPSSSLSWHPPLQSNACHYLGELGEQRGGLREHRHVYRQGDTANNFCKVTKWEPALTASAYLV